MTHHLTSTRIYGGDMHVYNVSINTALCLGGCIVNIYNASWEISHCGSATY